jgi:hypothetical protein
MAMTQPGAARAQAFTSARTAPTFGGAPRAGPTNSASSFVQQHMSNQAMAQRGGGGFAAFGGGHPGAIGGGHPAAFGGGRSVAMGGGAPRAAPVKTCGKKC